MRTFTIENETNDITVHATKREATAIPDAECFSTAEELAELAAHWPASRMIEIWNSLPGVASVKKFKDRKTGVTRIWNVIQSLGESAASEAAPEQNPELVAKPEPVTESEPATELQTPFDEPQSETPVSEPEASVGAQPPDVAPDAAPAKTKATRVKKTSTGATNAGVPREGSKTSQVIAMLKREGGTTLEEIMTAMGWQQHTTRAMLSAGGSLTKKHGLAVASEKVGDKRTYSIKA
jgi:Protein of unknown function (DUF3489)